MPIIMSSTAGPSASTFHGLDACVRLDEKRTERQRMVIAEQTDPYFLSDIPHYGIS